MRILSGLVAAAVGAGVGLVVGAGPASAAEPRPFIYVAASAPGTVSFVDPVSGREVNTVKAGGGAGDVAVVPAWDAVLVTDANDNQVTAFAMEADVVYDTVKVGTEPRGVAAAVGLERYYVANFGDGTLSVVNIEDDHIVTVAVGTAPHGVAVAPDEKHVYVTTVDAVVVVDTATNTVTGRIPVVRPYGVAFAPDGSRAYVTGWTTDIVSVVDTATNTVSGTVAVGNRPYDVVVAPDGRHAYVSNWGSGTVSVLDTASAAATTAVPVAGGHPYGLDITPDGRHVYATGGGTNGTVTPIDTATNTAGAAIVLGHGVVGLGVGLIDPIPAKFTLGVTFEDGDNGSKVTATATASLSTVRITSYSFDFGDGTVVTGAEATARHTYAPGGSYVLKATATDTTGGTTSVSRTLTVLPRIRSLGLMALSNTRYVSAEALGSQPLVANRTVFGPWEKFDLLDAGDGDVVLRAQANGAYVAVQPDGRLIASGGAITSAKIRFQLVPGADGTFGLRSKENGKYVSGNNGTGPLIADRTAIGPWEQFYGTLQDAGWKSITANVNYRFVTAEAAGAQPLIANRTTPGPWEAFDLIDTGNGTVALFSHANDRFVTAENGGNSALIANRAAIGAWERFTLIRNPNGTTSLLAAANGKYVTAEQGGNQPLIANRTAIGAWEQFTVLA
jgi:YVTN family beta-propeller protein